jgi:hypothetical protein
MSPVTDRPACSRLSSANLGRLDAPDRSYSGSSVTPTQPTTDETRIAEGYRRTLDDLSRCAQAVRDGDWKQLAQSAEDLARRAGHLAVAAGELRDPATRPRAEVVVDIMNSTGSPTVRALHPAVSSRPATTTMTDPFTHPSSR